MTKHLMNLVCAAVGLMMGCGPKAQPASFDQPARALPARSFAVQWQEDINPQSGEITALHVSDQFVFAYTRNGNSHVLARDSGRLLHMDEVPGGAARLHPPVVLKDRVIYPTTIGLEVFDNQGRYVPHPTRPGDDRSKPFSQRLNYPIRSDVVTNGKNFVFFGADFPGGGRAVAVDMVSPYVPEAWTILQPGASVSAAPAILKDVVFVADSRGRVEAAAADNGGQLWTLPNGIFTTYGGIAGNLSVDASGLYVASGDGRLYCLTTNSGKVKWQYTPSVPLESGPVVTNDLVYQYVPGQGLAAIDKGDSSNKQQPNFNRSPRWIASSCRQFLAADDKYAYVRTTDNAIVAVDKATGKVDFRSNRTDLREFGTNTKDNMIYCSTASGRVIAVRPVLQAGAVGQMVLGNPVAPAQEQFASAP